MQAADHVALAVVESVGPARFNTPDGTVPADFRHSDMGSRYVIYRPITLRVIDPLKGTGQRLESHILGGEVPGFRYDVSATPQVRTGERVLIFLDEPTPLWPTGPLSRSILVLYHLDDEGNAADREAAHRLPITELLQRVREGADR